jgi:hypothetical protein
MKLVLSVAAAVVLLAAPADAAGPLWLGIQGGAGVPFDGSGGLNLGITSDYRLAGPWSVGGEIGWHAFHRDFGDLGAFLGVTGIRVDVIPIQVHGKLHSNARGSVRPYVRLGAGLYVLRGEIEMPSGNDVDVASRLGLSLGIGMNARLVEGLSWGGEVLIHDTEGSGGLLDMSLHLLKSFGTVP